mgnify:CR=1 FL=1
MGLLLVDEVPAEPRHRVGSAVLIENDRQPGLAALLHGVAEVVREEGDVVHELTALLEHLVHPGVRLAGCPQLDRHTFRVGVLERRPDHLHTIARATAGCEPAGVLRREDVEDVRPVGDRLLQVPDAHGNVVDVDACHRTPLGSQTNVWLIVGTGVPQDKSALDLETRSDAVERRTKLYQQFEARPRALVLIPRHGCIDVTVSRGGTRMAYMGSLSSLRIVHVEPPQMQATMIHVDLSTDIRALIHSIIGNNPGSSIGRNISMPSLRLAS